MAGRIHPGGGNDGSDSSRGRMPRHGEYKNGANKDGSVWPRWYHGGTMLEAVRKIMDGDRITVGWTAVGVELRRARCGASDAGTCARCVEERIEERLLPCATCRGTERRNVRQHGSIARYARAWTEQRTVAWAGKRAILRTPDVRPRRIEMRFAEERRRECETGWILGNRHMEQMDTEPEEKRLPMRGKGRRVKVHVEMAGCNGLL